MFVRSNEELTSLESLKADFIGCQKLDISGNRLESLDGIEEAGDNLSWLKASNNFISDTKALKTCTKLSVLNLSSNKLKRLGNINMRGLKALILNNNELSSDNEEVFNFPQLNTLVLSHNKIKQIDLSRLPDLQKFSCSSNQIDVLPDMKGNKKIQEVRLNKNCIEEIPSWIGITCKKLKLLDVGNNCIKSFSSIAPLKELPSLESLNLKGNPICDDSEYVLKIRELLPKLIILDYKNFTASFYEALTAKEKSSKITNEKTPQTDKKKTTNSDKKNSSVEPSRGFLSTKLSKSYIQDQQSTQTSEDVSTKNKKSKKKNSKRKSNNDDGKDNGDNNVTSNQISNIDTANGDTEKSDDILTSENNVEKDVSDKVSISSTNDKNKNETSTKKEEAIKKSKKKKRKHKSEKLTADQPVAKKLKKQKAERKEKVNETRKGTRGRSGVISKEKVKKRKGNNKVVLSELISTTNVVNFGSGSSNQW